MNRHQTFNKDAADMMHPEGCQCPDDSGACDWCDVYYGRVEYDPTPYCAGCNARVRANCDCGPRAEND